jgi:hypothetical protein
MAWDWGISRVHGLGWDQWETLSTFGLTAEHAPRPLNQLEGQLAEAERGIGGDDAGVRHPAIPAPAGQASHACGHGSVEREVHGALTLHRGGEHACNDERMVRSDVRRLRHTPYNVVA